MDLFRIYYVEKNPQHPHFDSNKTSKLISDFFSLYFTPEKQTFPSFISSFPSYSSFSLFFFSPPFLPFLLFLLLLFILFLPSSLFLPSLPFPFHLLLLLFPLPPRFLCSSHSVFFLFNIIFYIKIVSFIKNCSGQAFLHGIKRKIFKKMTQMLDFHLSYRY